MHRRIMLVFAFVLTAGLTLAACGGTEEANETGEMSEGGAASITVKTVDTPLHFDPADVSADAGQDVNITLDNSEGVLEHSWVIMNAGVTKDDALNVKADGDDDKKFFTAHAAPGEVATATFTAPAAPGEYVIACVVPGHAAGGMVGLLTVK